MIVTGIGDEAGNAIETQIAATKELGWKHLEMRGIEVAVIPKPTSTIFPMRHSIPQSRSSKVRACAFIALGPPS